MYAVSINLADREFNIECDAVVVHRTPFVNDTESPIEGANGKRYEILVDLCISLNEMLDI